MRVILPVVLEVQAYQVAQYIPNDACEEAHRAKNQNESSCLNGILEKYQVLNIVMVLVVVIPDRVVIFDLLGDPIESNPLVNLYDALLKLNFFQSLDSQNFEQI